MSIVSRIAGGILRLPPAVTHNVAVERALGVPMPDGAVLLADRYYPRGTVKAPVILIRCPYGRTRLNALEARLLAERGFQVLLQSCRGTYGSGGYFTPFRDEQADGLATIEWLKKQDWFPGVFGVSGASYSGYCAWAIARDAGPELKALAVRIAASDVRGLIYPGGSFALSLCITWNFVICNQEKSPLGDSVSIFAGPKVKPTFKHLPLCEADTLVIGQRVQFWRELLEHCETGDRWWEFSEQNSAVGDTGAAVSMVGGWYDIFLPGMMKDYAVLKNAGRAPFLMIGPWSHVSPGIQISGSLRESISWLRAQLFGDTSLLRKKPVRLYVMGLKAWRDFTEWPPPGYGPQAWYLQPEGGLAPGLPPATEADRYRYNPADPTPNVGGALMGGDAGQKDNRGLEARPDVLVYTGAVLDRDLEAIGPVQAVLYVHSSLDTTDFFVRLCDVFPSGKSINISDGIRRLKPGCFLPGKDGVIKVDIEMWPAAYCFRRGHRIRLQVSSGAHPRFARNTGSGEPLATGVSLRIADQAIYHDPLHPSHVLLPNKLIEN